MEKTVFVCLCFFGVISTTFPQTTESIPTARAKASTPLVLAQEFHIWWRTPKSVSGQPVTGVAPVQPWSHWEETQGNNIDPEQVVSGTWRRNTLSKGYPMIGPFDSRNLDVLRWHIRLAKNSGMSGLLVDFFFDNSGYFDSEFMNIFAELLDISQQENFKIGILDEASFGADTVKNLTIMTDRATKALQRFKDHPAYLRINNQPVYQFNFYGNFGGKWTYVALDTFFTRVQRAVGDVYWMIQDGDDQNALAIAKLDDIEEHPVVPTTNGIIDWAQATTYGRQFVSDVHSHQKQAAINVFPGFDEEKLKRATNRIIHRDNGNSLQKQLDIASQAGADLVVISSYNDWQENSAVIPGLDFEDYAGDPYQYLKIVAAYTGTAFTPPPLPSKDSLDPLIWGKLFGIDKAGPVPSQITFDSDSSFSTTLVDDMSNVAAAEYFVDGFHSIRLKATNAENGLHLANVSDGVTSVVTRSGRTARATDGTTGHYFYIDDSGLASGDYDAYVAVEYFDNGFASFGLQFASTAAAYNSTSVKVKENTNTWKTYVFHLDHATFANAQNGGADFRVFQYSDSLIVARVGVMLAGKGTPMFAQDGSFNSLSEKVYHAVSAINDGDTHGIYVHGKDAAGNWGIAWTSSLNTLPPSVTAPVAPTLASPTDGTLSVSTQPTLTWSAAVGATSYRLQVSTVSTFSSLVLDDSTMTTTSRQIGPVSNGTKYYWRVAAKNYKGTGSWSTVRSFTTIVSAPQAPTLTAPTDSAVSVSLSPVLSWAASAGATSYRLQVGTNSSFPSPIVNDSTLTATSGQIGPLTNNTRYYWRMSATNAGGTSSWSAVRSFTTVVSAPQPPTLATPVDSAKNVQLSASLSWNSVVGATSYHLQLSQNATITPTVVNDSTLTTTSKAIGSLSLATTYYWRVRAKNDGGYSAFSSTRQFSTIRTTFIEQSGSGIPTAFALDQNYPNPFNPATTIHFALPSAGLVSLKVFDLLGREVATLVSQELGAGYFTVKWQADVPSGMYVYRIRAGDFVQAKKMTLLR